MIHRDLKKFSKEDNINLEDEEFLNTMETIYRYPGEFSGKTISFKGFMYQTKELKKNQYFLFRFGIIHCIADSGVFGMLIEFPDDAAFKMMTGQLLQAKLVQCTISRSKKPFLF